MASASSPSRAQFPRSSITGKVPENLSPGSLAVNWADGKLYVGGPNNVPQLLSQRLKDWSSSLIYRAGDLVVYENDLWRARRNLTANAPFINTNWEVVTTSRRATISEPNATSLLSGGKVTVPSALSPAVTVAAGSGIVIDTSDPLNVDDTAVSWSQFSVNVGGKAEPWTALGIAANGSLSEVVLSAFTDTWRRQHILLAFVLWDDSLNAIADVVDASLPSAATAEAFRDAYYAEGGAYRARGLRPYAGGGLQLGLTDGTIFDLGGDWRDEPASPNTITIAGSNPLTFKYALQGALLATPRTALDPANYDNGGTFTAVPAGNATIQYLSMSPGGAAYIQYGQTPYASINAALAALPDDYDALIKLSATQPFVTLAALVMATTAAATATDVFIVNASSHGDPFGAGTGAASDNTQFLLLDGSRPMVGNLDMGGFAIENGVLDGGAMT